MKITIPHVSTASSGAFLLLCSAATFASPLQVQPTPESRAGRLAPRSIPSCSGWGHLVSYSTHSRFYDVVAAHDGGVGYLGMFVEQLPWKAWVVRADPAGAVVWERGLDPFPGESSVAVSGAPTPAGGLVVAGVAERTGSGLQWPSVWVAALDPGGSVLWARSFETETAQNASWWPSANPFTCKVAATPDGGSLLALQGRELDGFGVWIQNVQVLRLDPAGAPVWSATLGRGASTGLPSLDRFLLSDLAATGDGGAFVLGTAFDTTVFAYRPVVVRLDPAGDPIWGEQVGAEGLHAIASAFDGGAHLAGGQRIARIDPAGAVVWARALVGTGLHLDGLVAAPDAGCVVAGSSDVFRLDPGGALIWQTRLSPLALLATAHTGSGRFLVAGLAYPDPLACPATAGTTWVGVGLSLGPDGGFCSAPGSGVQPGSPGAVVQSLPLSGAAFEVARTPSALVPGVLSPAVLTTAAAICPL